MLFLNANSRHVSKLAILSILYPRGALSENSSDFHLRLGLGGNRESQIRTRDHNARKPRNTTNINLASSENGIFARPWTNTRYYITLQELHRRQDREARKNQKMVNTQIVRFRLAEGRKEKCRSLFLFPCSPLLATRYPAGSNHRVCGFWDVIGLRWLKLPKHNIVCVEMIRVDVRDLRILRSVVVLTKELCERRISVIVRRRRYRGFDTI